MGVIIVCSSIFLAIVLKDEFLPGTGFLLCLTVGMWIGVYLSRDKKPPN